jgi:two-component system CheB/CheR fusion protein
MARRKGEAGVANHAFEALLDYLKRNRGFDFTGYKRSTLVRRASKRMAEVGIRDYAGYQDYLEVHPDEFASLFNTILINVTAFFRDPPVWEHVAARVLPALVADKKAGDPIRVWSAGCASGEEPYTLAMLLCEALGEAAYRRRVKIYATDVDEEALAVARRAVYSAKDVETVPKELFEKYFERQGTQYPFRPDIRRSVIFGRHDLVQDVPISRIDLLVCRNLLRYLNAETQAQVLARLHFALNPGGVLLLGKAEMLLSHADLFTPVELGHRLFTKLSRAGVRDQLALLAEAGSPSAAVQLAVQERVRESAFDTSPAAQIVVDAAGTLALANQEAQRLFALSRADCGRPLQDLEISYRPVELRSLIERAYQDGRVVRATDVQRALPDGQVQLLDVEVAPLREADGSAIGVSVAFLDRTELARLRGDLVRAQQELDRSNEQLQSANEELETTNEELQSTNEELRTINEQFQLRTQQAQRRQRLPGGDPRRHPCGGRRPGPRLPGAHLGGEDGGAVGAACGRGRGPVALRPGHRAARRGAAACDPRLPARRQRGAGARAGGDQPARPAHPLHGEMHAPAPGRPGRGGDPLDGAHGRAGGRGSAAARGRCAEARAEEPQALSENLLERRLSRSRALMKRLRRQAERQGLPPGSPLAVALEELAQTLEELSVAVEQLEVANEELTDARHAAERHALRYQDLFASAPDTYLVTDARGVIRAANRAAEAKFGREARYLVGKPLLVFLAEEHREAFGGKLLDVQRGHRMRIADSEAQFLASRGRAEPFWAAVTAEAIRERDGSVAEVFWLLRDVTQRRRAEADLQASEMRTRLIADSLPVLIAYVDREQRFRFSNATYEDWFGIPSERILGQQMREVLGDAAYDRLRAPIARALSGEEARFEGELPDARGGPRHVSLLYVPYFGESGEVLGFHSLVHDVSERKRMEAKLRAAAAATALAEDRERRRLADDLHDDLGQILSLAAIKLGALRDSIDTPTARERILEIEKLVVQAHGHTESLTFQLSPPVLHDRGFVPAAEWLAEDLTRSYGLRVDVEDDGEPKPLDEEVSVALFRTLRELLINVARHAGTTEAEVRIRREGERVRLEVRDRGLGFDPAETSGGFGLLSVRERLCNVGGNLEIHAAPGQGVRVVAEAPIGRRQS